jgi:hypothetical protein
MRKLAFLATAALFVLVLAPPAQAVPPANDAFGGATLISSLPFSEETTVTTDAGTETNEPVTNSCVTGDAPTNDSVAKTVWYKFVPIADVNFAADTFGSVKTGGGNYDSVVVLWEGTTLTGLTEVACSDDSGPDFASHSRVGFPLQGGTTYYLQVGSWTGNDANGDPVAPDTGTLHVHANVRTYLPGVVRGETWFLNTGQNSVESFSYGTPGSPDYPLVGTTTGDGISKPVVRNVNVWFLNFWFDDFPELALTHARWTDFPILGDWEGDTLASPGVVRGNTWFLIDSTDGSLITFKHGLSTDYPVVGDWDGNGTETPGLIRGNTWYVSNQIPPTSVTSFTFASATDFPIVGDWDGDGSMSPGVVRGNTWYLSNATPPTSIFSSFVFAGANDFPIAGDWDGAVTGLGVGGSSVGSANTGKGSGPSGPFRWAT